MDYINVLCYFKIHPSRWIRNQLMNTTICQIPNNITFYIQLVMTNSEEYAGYKARPADEERLYQLIYASGEYRNRT